MIILWNPVSIIDCIDMCEHEYNSTQLCSLLLLVIVIKYCNIITLPYHHKQSYCDVIGIKYDSILLRIRFVIARVLIENIYILELNYGIVSVDN